MPLTYHYHPLASYCWKALIALYEKNVTFDRAIVDLGDPDSRAAFQALWPLAKMPVLRDDERDRTVPEATIVIEYLDLRFPGTPRMLPSDPDDALRVRLADRFYDLHVHEHMQKIVGDRIRPGTMKDPFGVDYARKQLALAYSLIDNDMAGRTWATGDDFTLADCAASPALFYANKVQPFDGHPNVVRYFERLMDRPSFRRVLAEAEPYFKMFPASD